MKKLVWMIIIFKTNNKNQPSSSSSFKTKIRTEFSDHPPKTVVKATEISPSSTTFQVLDLMLLPERTAY